MPDDAEQAMLGYASAYLKLYKRAPKDLHVIDATWIVVNGARIHATELEHLTERLEQEYAQTEAYKRGVVNRLIEWFK